MPHRPWQPPSSHGCHGAPLLAFWHTTIIQLSGQLFSVVAPGVGHHGGCCRPYRSHRINRRCCVVVSMFLVKLASKQAPPTMATRFQAILLAPSMPNWLLLGIRRFGTSWWHDALRLWRHRRRNRSRRRGILLDVISRIDHSWWLPLSYNHHEAPLPARKHTITSQHARQQVSNIKPRKTYH